MSEREQELLEAAKAARALVNPDSGAHRKSEYQTVYWALNAAIAPYEQEAIRALVEARKEAHA